MSDFLILEYPLDVEMVDSSILVAALWSGGKFTLRGKPGTVGEFAVTKFNSDFSQRPPEDQVETFVGSGSYGRFQRKTVTAGHKKAFERILESWKVDKASK